MTFTGLHQLAERARVTPGVAAYRQKSRGIWRETGWLGLAERVAALAAGLQTLGVQRGDRVAVLSQGRIEAVVAQTAAQLIGALPVLMYPGAPEGVVGAQLARHQVRVVFCEDQEQTDKVLAQRVRLPALAALVTIDGTGVRPYRQSGIVFFDELERRGANAGMASFGEHLASVSAADAALVLHSLGTADRQNPVWLSHGQWLAAAVAAQQRLALTADDCYVSLGPLAHACEQQLAVALPLLSGLRVHFCESPRTALADLREIAPTVFMAPPRVWQALHNQCEQRASRTGGWRAGLYRRGLERLRAQSRTTSFWRWLLVRPLLNALGLTHVRQALVIAAAAPLRAAGFFAALGLPLRQTYALSEAGGFVAIGEPGQEDCGSLLEGFELRLGSDGELQLRRVAAAGDWIASGDVAQLDARGRLRCLGRLRDRVQRDDATLHPAAIETLLRESPYVRDAVVLSSRLSAPVALVAIDFEMVRDWADARRLAYTTYRSLSTRPEVVTLIEQAVAAASVRLAPHERIAHTLVLGEDLDASHGELTALGTARRHAVRNHHADRLLALHRSSRGPQENPA